MISRRSVTGHAVFVAVLVLLVIGGCSSESSEGDAVYSAQVGQLETTTPLEEEVRYDAYRNTRFDYQVLYPSNLALPEGEPPTRDGQIFMAPDSSFVMSVHGRHNTDAVMIEEVYDLRIEHVRSQGMTVVNEEIREDAFVLTHRNDQRVIYEHTQLRNDILLTLEVDIDQAAEDKMAAVVDRVLTSLRG